MHIIKKIDHVGIRIMDREPMIRFYQTLGFELIRDDKNEGVIVMKHASGIEINFIHNASDNHDGQNILMDISTKYPGYTHFALQVTDIDEAIHTLQDKGIEITGGPMTFGDSKTSIFVRDPERNVIELTCLAKA